MIFSYYILINLKPIFEITFHEKILMIKKFHCRKSVFINEHTLAITLLLIRKKEQSHVHSVPRQRGSYHKLSYVEMQAHSQEIAQRITEIYRC